MASGFFAHIPAVILAGGLGTRLRSVVGDTPKPMAMVAGRPFIEYLFEQLGAAGVQEIIISTGYRAEVIENHFGKSWNGISLKYSQETEQLGTGGALVLATRLVKGTQILALNGDSFCECDLTAFGDFHDKKQAQASVVLTAVSDTSRYGTVDVDSEGRIQAFKEKIAGGSGYINGGIYLFKRDLFNGLAPQNLSLERDLFPKWLPQGVYGFKGATGTFIDIGTPETFASAQVILSNRGAS